MRKRLLHAPHTIGKVNVTPMIDVVMCLIIFYLLVGKLATAQRVKDLPTSGEGTSESPASALVVDILPGPGKDSAPQLAVNGAAGDVAGLEAALKRLAGNAAGKAEVQIRAGKDLPYSQLAPVLAACRRAGLTSVRLVAERRQ